ncbi:MAG: hypothetical protein P0Y60_04830 [Candidatus Microbacterium colombiense]|nr:MAG: hypothetical protein P0Y60_04830 [Microbacterium sp.]
MPAVMDLDALLSHEDAHREFVARRDERMRALWAAGDAALRADPELVIELAKAAGAVARGEPLPPVPRLPQDDVGDERRARKRETNRLRWQRRKAERVASDNHLPTR